MSKYEEKLAEIVREKMKDQLDATDKKTEANLSNDKIKSQPSLKTKLKSKSIELMELEEINEQNIKNYKARNTRNKALIVILSVLLAISVATIAILLTMTYYRNNSFLYIHGGVDAVYLVDGKETDKFRTPNDVQGNRLLDIDIEVKMKEAGTFNIRYVIEVYQGDTRVENLDVPNFDSRFIKGTNASFTSESAITLKYNDTILLCSGILFDSQYEDSLNIDNFRMEIHIYFERV